MATKKRPKRKYGILSQLGYLTVMAYEKRDAERIFSKDYDLEKYPVTLLK